jgi:hypothetical protein
VTNRKRRRKRRIQRLRAARRPALGGDAARFRLASRVALGLGVALILLALVGPYLVTNVPRTLSTPLGIALRLAATAMIIAAVLFHRISAQK